MAKKEYNRPDAAAMEQVLENNKGKSAEVILRLVWKAGLSLSEVRDLKWEQVSFTENQINLPDRSVPMDSETQECLQKRCNRYNSPEMKREFVAITDYRRTHFTNRVNISNYINAAMKESGVTDITANDLRQDYIIRLLEQYDLPYVARVSGMTTRTLKLNYGQYIRAEESEEGTRKKAATSGVDEDRMIQLVKAEGYPMGIAIWLNWKMDVPYSQIIDLTWSQIDLDMRSIYTAGRYFFIDDTLEELLQQAEAVRDPEGDPHVLLTPKAKRPFEGDRLSVVIQNTLIRNGIEKGTLQQLKSKRGHKEKDDVLLQYLKQKGSFSLEEAMEVLQLPYAPTYASIQRLKEAGELVVARNRYYLPGTVVQTKEQREAILSYMKEKGRITRGDAAQLLDIPIRKCDWLFKCLVDSGAIVREKQGVYRLSEEGK